MKRLFAILVLASLSSSAFAQRITIGDLQRAAEALRGGGQNSYQNEDQPQNNYNLRMAPNASGNHNRGGFDPDHFFSPQNGGGNIYYPPQNNGRFPPQQNFPPQNYPPQTYPPQTLPQQNLRPPYQETASRYSDPPVAPKRKYSGQPIQLECWSGSQGACQYELVSAAGSVFKYNIAAGQNQQLSETTLWTLRYRPAVGGGWQTYRLRGGRSYQLRGTNGRWQLYMLP